MWLRKKRDMWKVVDQGPSYEEWKVFSSKTRYGQDKVMPWRVMPYQAWGLSIEDWWPSGVKNWIALDWFYIVAKEASWLLLSTRRPMAFFKSFPRGPRPVMRIKCCAQASKDTTGTKGNRRFWLCVYECMILSTNSATYLQRWEAWKLKLRWETYGSRWWWENWTLQARASQKQCGHLLTCESVPTKTVLLEAVIYTSRLLIDKGICNRPLSRNVNTLCPAHCSFAGCKHTVNLACPKSKSFWGLVKIALT